MKDFEIGFIGYGNMANAIVEGLVNHGGYDPTKICACAKNFEKLKKNTNKCNISPFESPKDVITKSKIIILAIKPYQIEEFAKEYGELFLNKLVVSVILGIDLEKGKALFPKSKFLPTMPNTPISVGEGIILCNKKHSFEDDDMTYFKNIFSDIAFIEMVDNSTFDATGTLIGCTPAFTAMYIEALSDAGVKYGITRDTTYKLISKMLQGTGKMAFEGNKHPGQLKDAVCSPGGNTIKGVTKLEDKGFRGAVISAIDAIEGK
ncbi:MAG: pyrroline-5-carboxylate reductase [Lachnospirales bacterium]